MVKILGELDDDIIVSILNFEMCCYLCCFAGLMVVRYCSSSVISSEDRKADTIVDLGPFAWLVPSA